MNILYISNVYPSPGNNKSPIVKNTMSHYSYYYDDNLHLLLFDRLNFLRNLFILRKYIQKHKIDIIHIHFGGLYAFFVTLFAQYTNTKVILTFHGTDIHGKLHQNGAILLKIKIKINKFFSLASFPLLDCIDFISSSLPKHINHHYYKFFIRKYNFSTLGTDFDLFKPIDRNESKKSLLLDSKINYILFVNNNNSLIKRENYAKEIVQDLGKDFQLLKLENIPYPQLPLYFNSCSFLLITSENEGSPNIIREALACNLPIISVDVGDIHEYIQETKSSLLIEKYDKNKAVKQIITHIQRLGTLTEDTRKKFETTISYKYTSEKLNRLYNNLIRPN